jgi:hypothetical protein
MDETLHQTEPAMRTNDAPPSLDTSGVVCPCCNAPCETVSLLTSMTRYYLCARCRARWQVARNWQTVEDGIAAGQGGAQVPTTR